MMALLASWGILAHLPMLSIGGGVLSAGLGAIGAVLRPYRLYFIGGAIIAGIVAVAATTAWIIDLQNTAEKYEIEHAKVAGLEVEYGCGLRDNAAEHELWACIPARDRDIKQAQNDALKLQADIAAGARNELAKKAAVAEEALRILDEQTDADQDAGEPLPAAIARAWDRERAARGAQ